MSEESHLGDDLEDLLDLFSVPAVATVEAEYPPILRSGPPITRRRDLERHGSRRAESAIVINKSVSELVEDFVAALLALEEEPFAGQIVVLLSEIFEVCVRFAM